MSLEEKSWQSLADDAQRGGAAAAMQVKESPWAPAWYDDADDLGEFLRR